MTTMNRLFELHSERKIAALDLKYEWSLESMRSSGDKLKRGNCVLDTAERLEK